MKYCIFILTLFITAEARAHSLNLEAKNTIILAKAVKLGRGNTDFTWRNANINTNVINTLSQKACIAHCGDCDTATGLCSKCEDGYWMEGGSCNLCSDFLEHCALCDSTGSTCTKCFDGYKLDGGSCMSGSCEDGYWWDGEESCLACPSVCKTCSDDSTCESCFEGYYHDMDRCVACSSNCTQCDQDGCKVCQSGYELKNGKCVQASCSLPHCLSCSGSACLLCDSNTELYEGNCCATEASCTVFETNGCYCERCNKDYMLTTEKLCTPCTKETPDHCKVPSPLYCGQCYTCEDGYIKNEDGECLKPGTEKPENCKTGLYNADGTYTCTQCNDGYKTPENGCNKCETSYYEKDDNLCEKCPENASCNGSASFSCDTGYTVHSSKESCIKCSEEDAAGEHCLECQGYSCTKCEDGWILRNGKCEAF